MSYSFKEALDDLKSDQANDNQSNEIDARILLDSIIECLKVNGIDVDRISKISFCLNYGSEFKRKIMSEYFVQSFFLEIKYQLKFNENESKTLKDFQYETFNEAIQMYKKIESILRIDEYEIEDVYMKSPSDSFKQFGNTCLRSISIVL